MCPSLHEIVPVVSIIFLKRSLVSPILLFASISLPWSLNKAFLSLLAILFNSTFRWEYLSFSPLPFASLLFSAIYKAFSDNHLPFCISFSWGWYWSLPPVQCHEPLSIVQMHLGTSFIQMEGHFTFSIFIKHKECLVAGFPLYWLWVDSTREETTVCLLMSVLSKVSRLSRLLGGSALRCCS